MANLTQLILVVSSKNPVPDLLMLDKQLAFAEFLNVEPIIVINKIDLDEEQANMIEKIYSGIGYTVIKTNAKGNLNVEELKRHLKGNISAFSGNSGVGKSTLINSIFKNDETQEGKLSLKNNKGKNTTTSVKSLLRKSSITSFSGKSIITLTNAPPSILSLLSLAQSK